MLPSNGEARPLTRLCKKRRYHRQPGAAIGRALRSGRASIWGIVYESVCAMASAPQRACRRTLAPGGYVCLTGIVQSTCHLCQALFVQCTSRPSQQVDVTFKRAPRAKGRRGVQPELDLR